MTTSVAVSFAGRLGRFDLAANFSVPASGVTALFGPSGCGKTTVLRCIAGLQRVAGTCVVAGEVWQDATLFLPPHRRPVGYVFQDARLFTHLTVRRNPAFGAPAMARNDGAFEHIVDLLGLAPLLDRAPHHLSGGERQRVAIGRALLSRPRILLMDEPLSALDQRSRDDILAFLDQLQARLAIPILYVTHDRAEVERLARTLVLMQTGRVVAAGPLALLQSDPASPLLGRRDAAVSLDAVVAREDAAEGLAALSVDGGEFLVPSRTLRLGSRHRLQVAAGDVSLTRQTPPLSTIVNVLPVCILEAALTADHEMTLVLGLGPDGGGARLLSRVTRHSWLRLELAVGQPAFAQVKAVALSAGAFSEAAPLKPA